jgi:predicted transcriptional regulator
MGAMATVFKDEAHKLVDSLPETADWDELIYHAVVRREIEAGLADSAAGRVTPAEEVLREFGLDK